jgi:hypothetical protein
MQILSKVQTSGCGYGLLPKRELRIAPWEEVAINLIAPWKAMVNWGLLEFNALTCIDMASNLVELICVDNKTAHIFVTSSLKDGFFNILAQCTHDKGGEFIRQTF